jgi:hypothetical protein
MARPALFSGASRPWRALLINNVLAAAVLATALSVAAWDTADVLLGTVCGLVVFEEVLWLFACGRVALLLRLRDPAQEERSDEDGNHLRQS